MSDVRPGQIWTDNDPRSTGRTIRVERIFRDQALCTILTNGDGVQRRLDRGDSLVRDRRGKQTSISLVRFCPTSTGYRLVADAPQDTTEGSPG